VLIFYSGISLKEKIKALKNIASSVEKDGLRGKKKDAKFDLLKFIHVTDSTPISIDGLCVEATQSLGSQRYTKAFVETITKGQRCKFKILLNERLNDSDKWVLEELGLDKKDMIDMLNIDGLFKTSYIRSKAILEEEEKYPYPPDIQKQIKYLKGLNQEHAPLLRLGSGQGFLSTTIDIHLLHQNSELFNVIREGVSFQRRWRTQKNNFPKTRRVVVNERNKAVSLLGWIRLTK
jgi:CRISPR type III-A-associated RAMP protein Csm5